MTFRDRGVAPPPGLTADDFLLRPIVAADAQLDHDAVMESREFLRLWEQSTWPEDDFTIEANRDDMVTMEQRHRDGYVFGYTMMNLEQTECLGCVYVFATDATWLGDANVTALTEHEWGDCGAVFSFWVRASRLDAGLDRTLLDALRGWVDDEWDVDNAVFTTTEPFAQQREMIENAGLTRRFELRLSGDPGKLLAYA